MSEFVDDFDLAGTTADGIENGDRLPNGWYHCFVKDLDRNNDSQQLIIEFEIANGPHEGKTITERLSDPSRMPNKNAQQVSLNRKLLFAKRLGLIPDNAYGQRHTIDWNDARDREVFLKIETRNYKKKDQSEGKITGITFDGIFPMDDHRVPAEVRGENGSDGDTGGTGGASSPNPPASGGGATATAPSTTTATRKPAPRRDFGDL